MPPSLTERLVDACWDQISAAVASGLALNKGGNALADVIPLSERPYGSPQLALPDWPSRELPLERIAAADIGEFIQVRFDHRLPLDLDSLADFGAEDEVRQWAEGARLRELTCVLQVLAERGKRVRLDPRDIVRGLPNGHGIPRTLLWEPLPAGAENFEADFGEAPKIVERPDTPNSWFRGLMLRLSGGPSVRRGQDLSLDWLNFGESIELVLMGHLRIYHVDSETVTTLLDPGVTSPVGG
jgi:hypothetical protein